MAERGYILKRNILIRQLYCELRQRGYRAKAAMVAIKKELRGELSTERIRKIIYSRDIPPFREA